jgi:hypothetical protein
MERLKLAPLYDVVGKESKGVFLGANDFTLGSEEPSQYCYLVPWYHELEGYLFPSLVKVEPH